MHEFVAIRKTPRVQMLGLAAMSMEDKRLGLVKDALTVTGIAALLASANPGLQGDALRERIISQAMPRAIRRQHAQGCRATGPSPRRGQRFPQPGVRGGPAWTSGQAPRP